MTAVELATMLDAKKTGAGWAARCPSHDDSRASLSIGEGDEGRVLLKCHASCDTAAVVGALNLTLADLQPARTSPRPSIVATYYQYLDEGGALLYEVVRKTPKSFQQRRPDGSGGWIYKLGDVRRVVYQLHKLRGCEAVVIVEGEKDADALWRLDIPATTNAGGVGSGWRSDYTAQLKEAGVTQVVIVPDNDEPGRAHGRKVAASCAGAGLAVKMLCLPGLPLKGDVSDYLASHTKAELSALLCDAPAWKAETLSTSKPAGSFPDSWRLLTDVQLLELPDPDFLIEGILQRRGVGVIYAPSGAGKTTLIAGLLTSLATGRDFFGHRVRHRGASVYVATEDPSGFKVRLRASKIAGRWALGQSIGVFTFPEPIDLNDAVSVGRFTDFLKAVDWPMPLECVVVDTYAAATPGANENSSEDTTTAMVHAQKWRDSLGVTVILVHHTNAGGSRERGHTAMRGAADFMISMTPVDDVIHVECSKQRNGPRFETLTLKLTPLATGEGCVLRLASDVLPSSALTPAQAKVYGVLRETFSADGATKSEWQRSCQDVPERTFHRVCKTLEDYGLVKQIGPRFRLTGKEAI